MLEDEARNAVLKMVVRAEEEALRRELERIAREATMDEAEDEELLDEARDVLGVYDGPTTGQRVNTTWRQNIIFYVYLYELDVVCKNYILFFIAMH